MKSKETLELLRLKFIEHNNEFDYSITDFNADIARFNIIEKDLERLEKLEKIIRDYCYIDNNGYGNVLRMCCEENEESNNKDFIFLKEVLEK